jgi:valyl-tRNA synthetase
MTSEMPKAYEPRSAEPRWYAFWEREGLFRASDDPEDTRTPYTIAIPPPNITGFLHMGHACRVTFEDVLIRYHRMLGRNALWVPGTDHAGIATQVVVERLLAREGKTRHEVGREAFTKRAWQWRQESGDRILEQLRVLGASCDWSRTRFTLDPELSNAVTEAFVRLFEEGLIYRDTRLISWCVSCRTALSDLEVENEENANGELFDFAYPIEGGGEIVVSTTRPETMLGDTAIAVHPDDPRYQKHIGKNVVHPFVDRRFPIIADAQLVDMKFGTGAVKVTPAHDPNDFATGKRHNLPQITVLALDGKMNDQAGDFAGLDRFAARKAVKEKLAALGLTRGEKPNPMVKPRCQRCNTVVEPMISTQWFCRMQPLAAPAIEAVQSGKTQLIPEHWQKTYFHWMRNIQDWCISRQLWWGHAIPAHYCAEGHITVARETPTKCGTCGKGELTPDPDVLDTWFSSALWPFSTLGWPKQTPDLARFYPTSDMETGSDILFFWVARMMMMGIHFMGAPPFSRILLSGMVTDERGLKMSKLKGNVIDPLDVIGGATLEQLIAKAEKGGAQGGVEYLKKTYAEGFPAYGADALRFTLLSYSPQTPKIALSMKRIEGYRNFCNKLWNAARYGLIALEQSGGAEQSGAVETTERPAAPKQLANRYILSRFAAAMQAAREGLDSYRLDEASGALYRFVWNELCDWYLELSKPLLAGEPGSEQVNETRATLAHVLEATMRALHPMTPFVTEEIWQRLPKPKGAPKSVMLARFPEAEVDGLSDGDAEREMTRLQAVIVAVRTMRAEHEVHPRVTLDVELRASDAASAAALEREASAVAALCNARVSVSQAGGEAPEDRALAVVEGVSVLVPLAQLVDPEKERERLERDIKKVEKDLAATEKKLGNASFVERAPEALVAEERGRLTELRATFERLSAALKKLKAS